MKQNVSSLMKKLLLAVVFLFLSLTTIVVASNLSQRFTNPSSDTSKITENIKLQICPDKWYKNEQPCVYQNSLLECKKQEKEYFIIDGKREKLEDVDVEWIKKNCKINRPEAIY